MTPRFLFSSTLVLLGSVSLLLALQMSALLSGKPEGEPYLPRQEVRGMAVQYKGLLFTLNFSQQNRAISFLNEGVKVDAISPHSSGSSEAESLVLYRFGEKPDLLLTPIAQEGGNLAFSIPEWVPHGYLLDRSEGALHTLLSEAHDP